MHVLARLLAHLRQKTDDRIVLVSNYTQASLCIVHKLKCGSSLLFFDLFADV